MEIRLLEKDDANLSFILKDTTSSFANTLRRLMIEEVPVMAIENVEFRKNSSILYDEIIASRLGLLPLSTDLKSYTISEKCKCQGKGCARCQLKMTLKVKGPVTAYASDIKSKDPKVKPTYQKMPIVKLLKGQTVELEATSVLGKGKDHAKWSPGLVYYKQKPNIEIGKCDNCGKCAEVCPTKTLEIKDNKAEVSKDHLFDCHLCNACVEACHLKSIKVEPLNDFIFYIESWGQLDCKRIVLEAANQFNEKLDEFMNGIKKL